MSTSTLDGLRADWAAGRPVNCGAIEAHKVAPRIVTRSCGHKSGPVYMPASELLTHTAEEWYATQGSRPCGDCSHAVHLASLNGRRLEVTLPLGGLDGPPVSVAATYDGLGHHSVTLGDGTPARVTRVLDPFNFTGRAHLGFEAGAYVEIG